MLGWPHFQKKFFDVLTFCCASWTLGFGIVFKQYTQICGGIAFRIGKKAKYWTVVGKTSRSDLCCAVWRRVDETETF